MIDVIYHSFYILFDLWFKMKRNSGNEGQLCFPIPEAGLAQKEMDEINEEKMETCPTNWHGCKWFVIR